MDAQIKALEAAVKQLGATIDGAFEAGERVSAIVWDAKYDAIQELARLRMERLING